MPVVLQVLCQRPGATGSGVTLERLAAHAAEHGFETCAVVGLAEGEPVRVRGLDPGRVVAVRFGVSRPAAPHELPHEVVGMSDVMPYPSRRWSSLGAAELESWSAAFEHALRLAAERFAPDLVHAHHAWLAAAVARRALPSLPLVVHGHGSDLRQFELAPGVGERVRAGLAGTERLVALHTGQVDEYARRTGLDARAVRVVGSGFDPQRFDPRGRERLRGQRVVFVGKLSRAKGVDALLLAFERLRRRRPRAELVLVGGGSGPESDALRERARRTPGVVLAGRLDDDELTRALHSAAVFALPSLWEGLPLVLLEGSAAGALPVATALEGVRGALAGPLGDALHLVEPPPTVAGERCADGALEPFADRLAAALDAALGRAQRGERPAAGALEPFTWPAVAGRVARVWREALAERGSGSTAADAAGAP